MVNLLVLVDVFLQKIVTISYADILIALFPIVVTPVQEFIYHRLPILLLAQASVRNAI